MILAVCDTNDTKNPCIESAIYMTVGLVNDLRSQIDLKEIMIVKQMSCTYKTDLLSMPSLSAYPFIS